MRAKDAFLTDPGPQSVARIAQCSRNAGAKTPVAYTVGLPGALSAIFHREAPARGGAFADGRRVVVGDEGGRRTSTHSSGRHVFSVTSLDPLRQAEARTVHGFLTLAHSSPLSVALRPRVAARSPMRGASWPATKADAKVFRPLGRCGRRGPCASLVASFGRAGVSKRSGTRQHVEVPVVPIQSPGAEARRDNVLLIPACSSPPSVALRPRVAARSPMRGASLAARQAAAFVDKRRIVAATKATECGGETLSAIPT
jgi:hypothetical protein